MMAVLDAIADGRANTDASLGAERAHLDDAENRLAHASELAHALVQRERLLADEPFQRFRDEADAFLALGRAAGPASSSRMRQERSGADEQKLIERAVTDAHVADERQRADTAIETERHAHDVTHHLLRVFRRETDEHLSFERGSTDAAVVKLGEMESELAHSHHEQARQRDVVGMVARDLRSPLTVIAVNAQLIADDATEEHTRAAALEAVKAAGSVARLLTDLLDILRLGAGVFQLADDAHGVAKFMNGIERSCRPLLAIHGLTLTVEIEAEAMVARFDRDRIAQVFSNLLSNAMSRTPAGGSVVMSAALRGAYIELAVHDSGPALAAESIPHVFERSWQKGADKRRVPGLDLYVCERIIKAHGGRIWAESPTNNGASFRFTLPMA